VRALAAALALFAAAPAAAQQPRPAAQPPSLPIAELQTLDKITGRVSTIDVAVGEPTKLGTLSILVRVCRKRPPEEPPESAAFIEITEKRGEAPAERLFAGWMFASSPAVSALEHPVYDVWMIDCKAARPASSSTR